jgi:hypothetical protein
MTNADDDQSVPPVPPVPPAASPYSPPPAAPAFSSAPPAYGSAPTEQPNAYANPYANPAAGPSNPYAVSPGPVAPRGLAIASMVTGIASVLFAFAWVGFLPGVAAVILGHIAQRRQPDARPFWLTGLITGYVGILIGLIEGAFIIFIIIAAMNSGSGYNDFS